jgi:hypothetical protein
MIHLFDFSQYFQLYLTIICTIISNLCKKIDFNFKKEHYLIENKMTNIYFLIPLLLFDRISYMTENKIKGLLPNRIYQTFLYDVNRRYVLVCQRRQNKKY